MSAVDQKIADFVEYIAMLKGDEKGEAQVFCDRLFQAFGWSSAMSAGAVLEQRIKVPVGIRKACTLYADLVWPPKLLLEIKSRGTKLEQHHRQAFEYWQYCTPHPRYVVLCNFDEFVIYDFDYQLFEPVDRVAIRDLPQRYTALNFLFPGNKTPQFGNDRVAVTREAADKVAAVFNSMIQRGVDRAHAQRFILQCVLSLFAEDIKLLPLGLFTELISECRSGQCSYDLFGALFQRMNTRKKAAGGRFKDVPYFNGGLFAQIEPVDLSGDELALLASASSEDWSKVQPVIFGTLFQSSMDKQHRHAMGAHFTSEADIQRIVLPTIVRPWREQIEQAETLERLQELRTELTSFSVLDPACGSGNFLYLAYREIVRLELEIVKRMRDEFRSTLAGKGKVATSAFVSVRQFYGIDKDPFAVELAKVTLLLGKKLAYDEFRASVDIDQLGLELESPLPLDNLDQNIIEADALFCDWRPCDVIIGNPPFQSKNKMQREFKVSYIHRLRSRYPEVSGLADYCVYWFRRAHDELRPNCRAGLVGTNTIRQNESRAGGLDYIADTGTIIEAVSTEVWSGDAAVHVSIVNWIKSKSVPGKKTLAWQDGDSRESPWANILVDRINSALSPRTDVTLAQRLKANADASACYQGQTHGHEGFLMPADEASEFLLNDPSLSNVLFPFLIGDDLLGRKDGSPSRYVIDFGDLELMGAKRYKELFTRVKTAVLADREQAAGEEKARNAEVLTEKTQARVNRHHANFLSHWWRLSWRRPEMLSAISRLARYIVCVRVTKRPVFEFVCASVRPNDALVVFSFEDDYSFGILQSSLHWSWFNERCSTLTRRFRYTSNTVFDSFPWPQSPTETQVRAVAVAALELRKLRGELMREHDLSRRQLYRALEEPGTSPLKAAQARLDTTVRQAYGLRAGVDHLQFLLDLNLQLAKRESDGQPVIGPGLSPSAQRIRRALVTRDCVTA